MVENDPILQLKIHVEQAYHWRGGHMHRLSLIKCAEFKKKTNEVFATFTFSKSLQ